jgi:gliding motility-associated-like protein
MRNLRLCVAALVFLLTIIATNSHAQCRSPHAGFRLTSNDLCVGQPIDIENLTIANGMDCYYYWNWGDGTTEVDSSFKSIKTHTYFFPTTEACTNPDGGATKRIELLVVPKDPNCKLDNFASVSFRIYFPPLPDFNVASEICMDNPAFEPFNVTCPTQPDSSTYIRWEVIDLATGNVVLSSTEKSPKFVMPGPGQYKTVLKVTNNCGTVTKEKPITVLPSPIADASVLITSDTTLVCAPYRLSLSNTSLGATSSRWVITPSTGWEYLNGTNANSPRADIQFNNNGVYSLSLIIKTACGDRQWFFKNKINVKSKPKVSMDTLVGSCVPFLFEPTSKVVNSGDLPLQYEWTLTGTTPTTMNTLKTGGLNFNTQGTFPIKFKASNLCGADSVTRYLVVKDRIDVVFVNVKDTLCNTGMPVQLTALPSYGKWSGTGVTTEGVFDPKAVGVGSYKLNFTASYGTCMDSKDITVRVFGVAANAGPPQASCANDPIPVILRGASPAGGLWSGTGVTNPSNGIFSAVIANAGAHTLTYTYTDPISGCQNSATKPVTVHEPPKANIDTLSPTCIYTQTKFKHNALRARSYIWHFGNGDSTTMENPTHIYPNDGHYNIRLVVTSAENCRDTAQKTLIVSAPPTADYIQSINQGCSPLRVVFTNRSIGKNATYTWNFGNGRTLISENPNEVVFDNTIDRDTTFTITMKASTPGCPVALDSSKLTVFTKPIANFALDIGSGCSPLKVQMSNVSMGSPRSYFWDFGNGKSSGDEIPTPQFYYTDTTTRDYAVRLVAFNTCGTDTLIRKVTVRPTNIKAFFGIDVLEGCSPLTVNFTNGSSRGSTVEYDLGDGTYTNNKDFTHTFNKGGNYYVRQKATGSCGADSLTRLIKVHGTPSVSFTHAQFNSCKDRRVEFKQNTSPNVRVLWDFGDSTKTGTHNPIHDYGRSGDFTVKLYAEDIEYGCKNETSAPIQVRSPLKFRLDSVRHAACFNSLTGAIVIGSGDVTGGLPAYEFSINDSTFKEPNRTGVFSNLKGREFYTVYVRDRLGCIDTASAYIKSFPPLGLDAGRDREIDLGDSTQTFVTTNATQPLDIKWSPSATVNCDTCEEVWLKPFETTTYTVQARGPEGCIERARVTVRVVWNRKVYVPNVFSPNGDGSNDMFFPNSARNIKAVRYFRVFNRWGEKVFENKDFQPNDPTEGWNGKFRENDASPDVYVWVMEIELVNGLIERFHGDVTLMK